VSHVAAVAVVVANEDPQLAVHGPERSVAIGNEFLVPVAEKWPPSSREISPREISPREISIKRSDLGGLISEV
jgi:hypothetical protein